MGLGLLEIFRHVMAQFIYRVSTGHLGSLEQQSQGDQLIYAASLTLVALVV